MSLRTYEARGYCSRHGYTALDGILGLLCELANAALQERGDAWNLQSKSISYDDQCQSVTGIRADDPDGRGAIAVAVARGALRRVDKAFTAFFQRVKTGKKRGYPPLKSPSGYKTIEGYRPDSCGNTRYVRRRRPSIRMFSLIAHEGDAGLGKERRGRSRSDPAPGRAARSSLTTRRSPRWKTARQLDAELGGLPGSGRLDELVDAAAESVRLERAFVPDRTVPVSDPDVSRPRRIRDATFLEADRREIALRWGPHNRLGFAYHVAFVRVLGRFPQQAPLEIDGEILRFAALQLGADAETIHAYARRQQTVSEHQQRISEYLRLRTFDTAASERLARFLEDEALRLDRTASLLARARGWLRDEHVLAPADSVLRRAVGAARHKARALLTQRMTESLSSPTATASTSWLPSATTIRIRRCTASRPARRARRSGA